MPRSGNEIKHRAIVFSQEGKKETREEAEAKRLADAFVHVFDRPHCHVASQEEPVKKLSGDWGFVDLCWSKTLLAKQKRAHRQTQAPPETRKLKVVKRAGSRPRGGPQPHQPRKRT